MVLVNSVVLVRITPVLDITALSDGTERSLVRMRAAMIRRFHRKVCRAPCSIIDSLRMTGHSRMMLKSSMISKLLKTLFGVALLVSLVLYPPSSAHAHASAHSVAAVKGADTAHHGGHGAHVHHDPSDSQPHLHGSDNGKSSDTSDCCQSICMAVVIAKSSSGPPDVNRAPHEATWLSSFSPFDPIEYRRPPKHLI